MRKIKSIFGSLLLLLSISICSTSKISAQVILSGDLNFLKGQKSINLVIDYSVFILEKETEAVFLKREIEEKKMKLFFVVGYFFSSGTGSDIKDKKAELYQNNLDKTREEDKQRFAASVQKNK